MGSPRPTGAGLGLALLSAATFGTSGTFARSLIDAGWSADAAVAARVGIAALVIAVPAVLALRGRWHVLSRSAGQIGLFGLLAVGGAQVGFFNAVRYLPVGVALLLEYSGIVLVVLWMWVRHGERPRGLTLAGAAVAVVGLILVLNIAGGATIDPVGLIWGLVAAVGLATYFIISSRVDPELPSIALACGGMAFGAAVLLALGVVGVLPMRATFGTVEFAGHTMSWLAPVAGLSLIAAVIAYVTGIAAARLLGAALSSFAGLTEVLFAVLIAWLVLGELPTIMQGVGGTFIIAGIALVRLEQLRTTAAGPVPAGPDPAGPVPAGPGEPGEPVTAAR
ncbi:membrane protein [Actinoplanes sp. NBRC 14428]|uniref:Threonine/homoserine efflux transporter RhtA n=1 Tax=Pseudosporangium ferrugineum TaxID=439699 RepID=A0A2T0RLH2_9ACTN|nr:DMT family transporter [Pseudosporangium ferrugineum]PRY22018.1 threonine/homoserine efflux transporter RhtA [Pseudosporangium ferrugineum]BCJ50707.1 membrane protein [Actinoplanes sp. NBRC 14428]